MKISPSRSATFKALLKIEKESAYSSVLLSQVEESLNKKDRSLCHQIVLGTLRNKLYIDAIIGKLTKKNLKKFDAEVITSLRIGIYQLLFLDKIPAYSAINESVNLVKKAKKKSASGLVNAVLRKVSSGDIKLSFANDIEKKSIETSHPIWLIEKWKKDFGLENAIEIALANNQPSELNFRLTNKLLEQDEKKQFEIIEYIKQNSNESDLIKDSFVAKEFNEDYRELAQKGFIYFQDLGSQLIAESVDLNAGESFLDVCASPGSKTTLISKCNKNKNLLVAGDFYDHRISELRNNCLNQGLTNIEIIQYDAVKKLPFDKGSFDVALVDAPCSGTGTIRNNPEIRYNLKETDILELSSKQLKILQNASKTIKNNGKLIYSTCSLEVEENEKVIDKFLEENSGFESIKQNISQRFLTDNGYARTFPHRDKMDGFFIATLIRNK